MRIVALSGILAVLAMLGIAVWQMQETPDDLLKGEPPPVGRTPISHQTVLVTVLEGESVRDVGELLEKEGVISSAILFRILVALEGYDGQLVAGDYELEKGMPTVQVIDRLHKGITSPLVVTIIEGMRAEEIADTMQREGVVSREAFLEAIQGSYDFAFLRNKPVSANLEGYLFPDTYFFGRTTTAEDAVKQMLENFDAKFSEELRQEADNAGLSLHTVVTLASIVEREAQVAEERPIIAGIFLRRLRIGMPLEADPTVQYALANDPESVAEYGYWKKELTQKDLEIDSPYNTYRRTGLPPGPICNPGLDSIVAVVRPAQTNYLYFVAKPDGSHAFAETLEEHLANVELYGPR
jgi:UPF0755 protein